MEGVAIWGAVASSIVVTNIVKGWVTELVVFVQEYNEAGETLQRFRERYHMSEVNLGIWREMWGVDENATSKRYTRELWGKKADQAILGCLGSIFRRNKVIQDTFTKILSGADLPASQNPQQLSATWQTLDEKKKRLTIRKTISFMSKSCSKLTRDLEYIEAQTKLMIDMARNAFQVKHDMSISPDFVSKTTLGDIKQTILYQLAFETRLASKGLYKSCFDACKTAEARSTKINFDAIEIDILRRVAVDMEIASSKEAIALQYQLLVSWPTKLLEISIEGPLILEESPEPSDGFFGACIKALRDEPEMFQIPIPDLPEPAWFRCRVPHKTHRIPSEPQLKPLSSLLHELDIPNLEEPLETFPRSERIRLAFKLAECGLFLLGTPWLSGLRVDLIQRSVYNLDRHRRFLLATQVSEKEISDNEFRQFAQQAFAIGVLLVEIGCGRLVNEIPTRSKTEGQGFWLHGGRLGYSTPATFVNGPRINEILVSAMGNDYANAVKVCLQSNESLKNAVKEAAPDRRKLYQGILADYYLGVFLP